LGAKASNVAADRQVMLPVADGMVPASLEKATNSPLLVDNPYEKTEDNG